MEIIKFSPPDIREEDIAAVVEVLRSGWITTGHRTKSFEKELIKRTNALRCVCLNSATAALELTLRVLGIGPGDEVITSAYTYSASCSVICHVGATPVLVDILPDTPFMDPERLRGAINERTKAIIPVDIAGVMADYETVYEIVKEKQPLFRPANEMQKALGRIAVVADAAHSLGAVQKGAASGNAADFTCFSFHAVKNLTTAEGGAVCIGEKLGMDADEIYHQFGLLSLHGQTKDAFHKEQLDSWEYDILSPAYKYNMTDVAAAMGLTQLMRYDEILNRRHEIYAVYEKAFADLPVSLLKQCGDDFCGSAHLAILQLPNRGCEARNELIRNMAEAKIGCNVHYKPLPMMTAYRNLGFRIEDYPNSYHFYENEITLPLHTLLTDEQVAYICETFRRLIS